MPIFVQNFPEYAQTAFEQLCNIVDLTKTRSIQDREGWDYLVEYARPRLRGLPHDQQPGNATVRVQVKSQVGRKPVKRIKLTNMLRFAHEPNPCFIVLWWRSPDHGIERIYARHFDEPLIEATLLRAREASRDGETRLNRITLPVTFTDADDHGADLIAWIRAIGDTDPHDYAAAKRTFAQTIGFGPDAVGGTVTLAYDDVQKLIDDAVGLPTEKPQINITIGNRRFDILVPAFSGKPDVHHMNAIAQPALLGFRDDAGRMAHFVGEARKFGMADLPIETVRATFTSPGMTGVLRGPEFNISYHFESAARHPFERLHNLARFLVMTAGPTTVSLQIGEDDTPLETTCKPMELEDRSYFAWLDDALSCLEPCREDADTPTLSANDLIAAHDDLMQFSVAGAKGTPTFTFTADRAIVLPLVSNLAAYRLVRVGEASFYTIFRRACLDQSATGDSHHFRFNDPVQLEAGVLEMAEADARLMIQQRFFRLAQRMGEGTLVLNGGDYLSVMRGDPPAIEVL